MLKGIVCVEIEWKVWEVGRKDGMSRKQIRECFILKPAYVPGGPIEDGLSAGSGWEWARCPRVWGKEIILTRVWLINILFQLINEDKQFS